MEMKTALPWAMLNNDVRIRISKALVYPVASHMGMFWIPRNWTRNKGLQHYSAVISASHMWETVKQIRDHKYLYTSSLSPDYNFLIFSFQMYTI